MMENWQIIEDFPNYVISTLGNIESRKTGIRMSPSQNQQGIQKITLYQDKMYTTLGIALLVAETFIEVPEYEYDTPTPIQLDGDRTNCSVENIQWRPRWFARQYNKERLYEPFPDWTRQFELLETGEIFDHPRDCAMRYGLLESGPVGIHHSIMNHAKPIFPFWYSFSWLS